MTSLRKVLIRAARSDGKTGDPVDTDSDGIPDYLDPDSYGDGVSDEVEKGAACCDGCSTALGSPMIMTVTECLIISINTHHLR